MRLWTWLVVVALAAGGLPARADMVYLAIGDSSAFGETNRTQNPSNGDRGYVKPFADYLGTTQGGVRPRVINLAIDGETTTSFFSGLVSDRASPDGIFHNTNYAAFAPNYPAQNSLMLSRIAAELAAGNTIGTITVQIGANDLSNTAETPGFLDLTLAQQQAAILSTFATVQSNYAGILTELTTLLPAADLYAIGYHNPYGGSPSHPFYNLAGPAVQGLNQVVGGVGTAFGAKYVDFYTPVLGREQQLTLIGTFPGDPVNYVHLNAAGYDVVADKLIQTAGGPAAVPAPGGLALGAIAAVGLIARRRRTAA